MLSWEGVLGGFAPLLCVSVNQEDTISMVSIIVPSFHSPHYTSNYSNNLYHLPFTGRFRLYCVTSCLCMVRIQLQAPCNQFLVEKK